MVFLWFPMVFLGSFTRGNHRKDIGTKPPSKLVVFGASSGGDVCCVAWVFDSAAWAKARCVCDTKFCCVKWYLLVVRNGKTIGKWLFNGI